jgi:hypothetical protein
MITIATIGIMIHDHHRQHQHHQRIIITTVFPARIRALGSQRIEARYVAAVASAEQEQRRGEKRKLSQILAADPPELGPAKDSVFDRSW